MKSESKIICKYFIHGKCIKGENVLIYIVNLN